MSMQVNSANANGYVNANYNVQNTNTNPVQNSQRDEKNTLKDVKTDTINISAEGISQSEIQKEVKNVSDEISAMNASDKVEDIKSLITSGQYNVSATDVAGAILSRFM